MSVGPKQPPELTNAVREAGADLVELEDAEVLVWFGGGASRLSEALDRAPRLRWVQLPLAGIESVVDVLRPELTWVCAKGVYGPVVAEHGLALMLAAARGIHRYARRSSWAPEPGRTLSGTNALLLGGGGITGALTGLLAPLGVRMTVVRKHLRPMPGVDVTIGPGDLPRAIGTADWVVVAWALTPETERAVDAAFMERMRPDAWLINLGRGRHVHTDDLVAALREGAIGGAALDVTDPEPLPDDHPLWSLENALVTPHVANHWEIGLPLLAERLRENLRRDRDGEPLLGLVDVSLGY